MQRNDLGLGYFYLEKLQITCPHDFLLYCQMKGRSNRAPSGNRHAYPSPPVIFMHHFTSTLILQNQNEILITLLLVVAEISTVAEFPWAHSFTIVRSR